MLDCCWGGKIAKVSIQPSEFPYHHTGVFLSFFFCCTLHLLLQSRRLTITICKLGLVTLFLCCACRRKSCYHQTAVAKCNDAKAWKRLCALHLFRDACSCQHVYRKWRKTYLVWKCNLESRDKGSRCMNTGSNWMLTACRFPETKITWRWEL